MAERSGENVRSVTALIAAPLNTPMTYQAKARRVPSVCGTCLR